jgi:hypothetical protein
LKIIRAPRANAQIDAMGALSQIPGEEAIVVAVSAVVVPVLLKLKGTEPPRYVAFLGADDDLRVGLGCRWDGRIGYLACRDGARTDLSWRIRPSRILPGGLSSASARAMTRCSSHRGSKGRDLDRVTPGPYRRPAEIRAYPVVPESVTLHGSFVTMTLKTEEVNVAEDDTRRSPAFELLAYGLEQGQVTPTLESELRKDVEASAGVPRYVLQARAPRKRSAGTTETLVRTVNPGRCGDQGKHPALNVHVDQARPGR